MIYNTNNTGAKYEFCGWKPTESPLEYWDRGDYLACLHACMVCYGLIGDDRMTQLAVEDDGLLHELLHLAVGNSICTHLTLSDLRVCIECLEQTFKETVNYE